MKWLLDRWHNSCFDVRTGRITNRPAKVNLKTFKVETRDGKVCIGVPRAMEKSP
jgi:nitrite reductase/ring-hydroxylating ferredoxin subunit